MDCWEKQTPKCALEVFYVRCFISFTGNWHCVKSVQIRSYFWSVLSPNTGKYGPEKTLYLDTFHAVWSMRCFSFFVWNHIMTNCLKGLIYFVFVFCCCIFRAGTCCFGFFTQKLSELVMSWNYVISCSKFIDSK